MRERVFSALGIQTEPFASLFHSKTRYSSRSPLPPPPTFRLPLLISVGCFDGWMCLQRRRRSWGPIHLWRPQKCVLVDPPRLSQLFYATCKYRDGPKSGPQVWWILFPLAVAYHFFSNLPQEFSQPGAYFFSPPPLKNTLVSCVDILFEWTPQKGEWYDARRGLRPFRLTFHGERENTSSMI